MIVILCCLRRIRDKSFGTDDYYDDFFFFLYGKQLNSKLNRNKEDQESLPNSVGEVFCTPLFIIIRDNAFMEKAEEYEGPQEDRRR